MTEAEWYELPPVWGVQKLLEGKGIRKHYLFMTGSIRITGAALRSQHHTTLLNLIEDYADGRAKKTLMSKARSTLRGKRPVYPHGWTGVEYLLWCALNPDQGGGIFRFNGSWDWAVVEDRLLPEGIHSNDAQLSLIRELLGNPHRPVILDPSWLTPTVVALANGIYADRAFDRMPILADALEEAGCDNADVLLHCRGDGPHVKGCWVVDAVLGKE